MFQLLFRASFALGPKSFLTEHLAASKKNFRQALFALSICNLAYILPTLLASAVFWLVLRQGDLAGWLPQRLGEDGLVFVLTDNRIDGVLFGILIGALTALVLRRVWPALLFCAVALASGVMAVNVGWGVWMGLCLGFWIYSGIHYRKLKPLKMVFRLRTLITVVTILLIFRYSDFFAISVRSLEFFEGTRDNRFVQWVATGVLTLAIDTGLAALFFHFYFLLAKKD